MSADTITQNDKFDKKVVKLYKAMRYMEQHKFQEPKFTEAFESLAKSNKNCDTLSRFSSVDFR